MSMWIIENWSTIISIITLLSVGYVTVRKFEKILGKDSKGRTIAERLDRVEHQLFPNGGSSLADKVNCLADGHEEIRSDLKAVNSELKLVHDILVAYITDKK
jgi:hypothetical protein